MMMVMVMSGSRRAVRGHLQCEGDVCHMRCVGNVRATLAVLDVRRVLEELHEAEVVTTDDE